MQETFVEKLMERAARAADEALAAARRGGSANGEAVALNRRARLLRAFVASTRRDRSFLPRRCAWCGRVEVDGEFVDPHEFLDGDMPSRLRERATHGICPDCLERVQRQAAEERGSPPP